MTIISVWHSQGKTLAERLATGPLAFAHALTIARQIVDVTLEGELTALEPVQVFAGDVAHGAFDARGRRQVTLQGEAASANAVQQDTDLVRGVQGGGSSPQRTYLRMAWEYA